MRRLLLSLLVALLAVTTGCAMHHAPVVPPRGLLFTSYKAPLVTDCKGTDLGTRKGTATSQYLYVPVLLWWGPSFAWGDASLDKAVKNGEIETLKGGDYEYLNVLLVYSEFTVHAYGD